MQRLPNITANISAESTMRKMPGLHTTDWVGSSTSRRFTTGHPAHLQMLLPEMMRLHAKHSTIRRLTSKCLATTAKHWTFSVNLGRDFLNGKGSRSEERRVGKEGRAER